MMTPKEIVHELDKHIVGQDAAKRAVAVALRNRWRRSQVAEPMRTEIVPKNILMIGPTGVGKTEIARRLARLADAPFIKVEATKFTEVGYVGRDVDAIVRDLVEIAIKQTRETEQRKVRGRAEEAAEERILDALLPGLPGQRDLGEFLPAGGAPEAERAGQAPGSAARQKLRRRLRDGELDAREIEIELAQPAAQYEVMAPPGMEEITQQLQGMLQNFGQGRRQMRKLAVAEARKALIEEEAARLVGDTELKSRAIALVENHGIVFIDEIDKIAARAETQGSDVSRQGVQRDLLPLIEGTSINTKHGVVRTDHILFIASGAFHYAKPSDLMPELQGRLPIRVELSSLGPADFERILTSTDACLTRQYQALLAADGVALDFPPEGVARIAQMAASVNQRTEDIGARRLHTMMEKLLEEVAFEAGNGGPLQVTVDAAFVEQRLGGIAQDEDLARFVL